MANEEMFNVNFDQISDDNINLGEINKEEVTETQGEEVEINDVVPGVIDQPKNDTTETPAVNTTTIEDTVEIEDTAESNTDSNTKDKGPDSDGSSSPVTPFASFLQEKGFLRNLDMDAFKQAEDPMQALADAWGQEVQIMQEQIINSFPPELIDMAKAVSEGVPLDSLKDAKIQELNYNRITEDHVTDNTNLQKKLVGDYLQSKGFKPEKISSLIETYEDSGRLGEEAKDALGELKQVFKVYQENAKKQHAIQQKQFEQQHHARIQHIQKTISDTEAIIPGMNLTDKAKQDLFANMTQIVGQDPQGNPIPYTMSLRQEDPLKFDLAVTYLAQTTKGFTDWSKLTKKAKSSATSELEQALQSTPRKGGGSKSIQAPIAEGDLMNSLEKMFK